MKDLPLTDKRVLIRADLNVPLKQGRITSDARIRALIPTLQQALQQGARIMLASHLGRPTEGEPQEAYSLQPVVHHLKTLLNRPVRLAKNYLQGVEVAAGELVVLENVRFNLGESENDPQLAQQYAALCDLFVMDAFASAHRMQASTYGVAHYAPMACAGPLLLNEIAQLTRALHHPARPLVAIVGGSKISSKLPLLQAIAQRADHLIVGGGIANTFLAAQGYPMGQSLYEAALIPQAQQLLATTDIPLPSDVRVAHVFSAEAPALLKPVTAVAPEEQILDIGPATAQQLVTLLSSAKTILWNGPLGVFEWPNFRRGTEVVARAIANSHAFSIAGGGDTLAAIDCFGIAEQISYISTGGGAFLAFIEGKSLPAIKILERRGQG
ncbi:phosphoglycerate kinase [unidentified bacterial endosymbiont]|uniref:phosphoglycerate kinase n=1 Tax=unidentified bacterial endosymbiont TaxID=2355 RepID=UPI0020A0506E|nr:phosphoglycerate kinase [unidentified bacterial endosymbiont]